MVSVCLGWWSDEQPFVRVSDSLINECPAVTCGLQALGGEWTYSPERLCWERRVDTREEYERLCAQWGQMGFSPEAY